MNSFMQCSVDGTLQQALLLKVKLNTALKSRVSGHSQTRLSKAYATQADVNLVR